jgi:DNA replication protein DnaC
MNDPTNFSADFDQVMSPRQRAEAELEGSCRRHPGHPTLGCPRCAVEERALEKREIADAAEAKCVERFPLRYREATVESAEVQGWVRQFQVDYRHAPSLLLMGPTGTGKTHAGYAALRAAVSVAWTAPSGALRSPRWQAMTYADLCASLRPRGRDYDIEAVLKSYLDTDLLFIDDLGAGKVSEAVEEVTYRLINGRYNDMRPSIFTTNLSLQALKDAIGDRIASRLAETCTRVVLDGPDRRRQSRAA